MIYPLIQFGAVYATDDNLSTGDRYISEIEGLEQFALADRIGTESALDFTRYSQVQAVKDMLVRVRFPLIDFAKFDAIRDVVNTAAAGLTTYPLNITINGEAFTFTAKPAENAVTYQVTNLLNKVGIAEFRQYCTD